MSRFSLQFACAFLFSAGGHQFWPQTKLCVTGLGTRPLLSPTLKTGALARERQLLCSHFLQVFVSLWNTAANRANLLRSPVLSVSLPPDKLKPWPEGNGSLKLLITSWNSDCSSIPVLILQPRSYTMTTQWVYVSHFHTPPGRVLSAFRKQPDLNEELHEEVAKSACVILV